MRIGRIHELPTDRQDDLETAQRFAWITIAFMVSAITVLYLTLGSSQAMKAAWIEDLASLVPPISFLVASRFADRPPDEEHPFGLHRSVSIAYLFSSVALFGLGLFILTDSVLKLVSREHPTIGSVTLFGHTIWLGWLMIAALAYTIAPAVLLGMRMLPLASRLHDKSLYAIAKMLKADWSTAAAGIIGILGIGLGMWWADGVAAIFISLDISRDGWTNSRTAARELADGQPRLVDGSAVDPLRSRLQTELEKVGWVRRAHVRVRDEGHVFFAEALVVPAGNVDARLVEQTIDDMLAIDWRLHQLTITPVETIEIE
jgi:cation diffusion facilitator family transporter